MSQFPVVSETFVVNQAVGLLDQGHEVELFALQPAPALSPDGDSAASDRHGLLRRAFHVSEPSLRYGARRNQALLHLGLRAHHAPGLTGRWVRRMLQGERFGEWLGLLRAARALGRGPYDVVHAQFGTVGRLLLELRRYGVLTGRLVVHFRGADASAFVRKHGEDVYDELLGCADHVVTNSDYFRRRLLALGCPADRLSVVPSSVDPAAYAYREPREVRRRSTLQLVAVGRLVEKKGMEYALRAAAILAGARPIALTIVGDGPLRPRLEELAVDLGVSEHVTFLGQRDPSWVAAELSRFDLLLAPSVTASDGDEDAPVNTVKEAMLVGLPVVATRHGGIPEVVQDHGAGRLVAERDPQGLAHAIVDLVEEAPEWPRTTRLARSFVIERYGREKVDGQLERLYRELLSKPPRAPEPPAATAARRRARSRSAQPGSLVPGSPR